MKILCVTGSRADWNGISMVAAALKAAGMVVNLAATGQWDEGEPAVEAIHFPTYLPSSDDRRVAISKASGWLLESFSEFFDEAMYRPDLVILAGDRWEIMAVAVACSLMGVPIAHIGGGDVTEGSDDDRYRNAITALAELHFATNGPALDRLVRSLGEAAPGRVWPAGDPEIDRICSTPTLGRADWLAKYDLEEGQVNPLVLFHPTAGADSALGLRPMLEALGRIDKKTKAVVLGTNADPGGAEVQARLRNWAADGDHLFFHNIEPVDFYSARTWCDFMIGNSSAGLHEAPLFSTPVVNVGDRQKGRIQARNVIQVAPTVEDIWWGIQVALTPRVAKIESPYGDGKACGRIVAAIETWAKSREKPTAL